MPRRTSEPDSRNYLRSTVTIAALCLLFGPMALAGPGGDLGPGDGQADLPPDLSGGIGALTPQSQADLMRTREELYGQSLTPDQHEWIASWRPNDVDWWLDPEREANARSQLFALEELVRRSQSRHGKAEIESDIRAFGLQVDFNEFGFADTGSGDPRPSQFGGSTLVTYDGLLRPDLFSIHDEIYSFLIGVLRDSDPSTALAEDDDLAGFPFSRECEDPNRTCSGWMSRDEFLQAADLYVKSCRTSVVDQLDLIRAQNLQRLRLSDAQDLTVSDLLESVERVTEIHERELARETGSFLQTLPTDLKTALVLRVAGSIQQSRRTKVVAGAEFFDSFVELVKSAYEEAAQ